MTLWMISLLCAFLGDEAKGTLDSRFSGDGKIVTPIGALRSETNAVVLQPDGRILVAGSCCRRWADDDFLVLRYASDGSPDLTFGSQGRVRTDLENGSSESATSMVVQPDGKIVVAGHCRRPIQGYSDFAVVRYRSDGTLDSTFGTEGRVWTDIRGESDFVQAILIQPDGAIVVAGNTYRGAVSNMAVVRYTADGKLDTSFGNAGKVWTDFDMANARAALLQPDGKIVVGGLIQGEGRNYDFVLVRYHGNGTVDSGFGTKGRATLGKGASLERGMDLALQPDGKIVVAGGAITLFSWRFVVGRFNQDGTPDLDFAGDGMKKIAIGGSMDVGCAVAVQSNGKIVVAGYSASKEGVYDFAAVRFETDGSVDKNFGDKGSVTTSMGAVGLCNAMAIQPDGRILLAGTVTQSSGGYAVGLVRYK